MMFKIEPLIKLSLTQYIAALLFVFFSVADVHAQECIGYGFGYTNFKGVIYYGNADAPNYLDGSMKEVLGSDVSTFEILPSRFDDNFLCGNVGKQIKEYGKDSKHVYYMGEIIEGADPSTFHILNQYYSVDKKYVFHKKEIISDKAVSFSFLLKTDRYASDGDFVYFQGLKKFKARYYEFVPGTQDYLRTENGVYYYGDLIAKADPESFVFYRNHENRVVTLDRSHVFLGLDANGRSDGKKFIQIGRPSEGFSERYIYMYGPDSALLNRKEAHISEGGRYVVDDKNVFAIDSQKFEYGYAVLLKEMDVSTFKELALPWSRDKSGVYYNDVLVPGIDIDTFESERFFGRDKNYEYKNGMKFCTFRTSIERDVPVCKK
jgi:hypothetical protein